MEKLTEFRTCADEVLYYIWDPLEVSDTPSRRAEYAAFVDDVVAVALATPSTEVIMHYLAKIARERLLLYPDMWKCGKAACNIRAWYDTLTAGEDDDSAHSDG